MNTTTQNNRINDKTCNCCGKELDRAAMPAASKVRNFGNKWFYVCSWECLDKETYAEAYCRGL